MSLMKIEVMFQLFLPTGRKTAPRVDERAFHMFGSAACYVHYRLIYGVNCAQYRRTKSKEAGNSVGAGVRWIAVHSSEAKGTSASRGGFEASHHDSLV